MFQEGSMHSLQRKRMNGSVAEEKSDGQTSKCRTDVKASKEGESLCLNSGASTVGARSAMIAHDAFQTCLVLMQERNWKHQLKVRPHPLSKQSLLGKSRRIMGNQK